MTALVKQQFHIRWIVETILRGKFVEVVFSIPVFVRLASVTRMAIAMASLLLAVVAELRHDEQLGSLSLLEWPLPLTPFFLLLLRNFIMMNSR